MNKVETPNLNRLLHRWWLRAVAVIAGECLLCMTIGLAVAGSLLLALRLHASRTAGWAVAAVAVAAFVGLAVFHPAGRSRRNLLLSAFALGWALASVASAGGGSPDGWRAISVHAATLLAIAAAASVALVLLAGPRIDRRLSMWLDAHARTHLLLTTARELAADDKPLNQVERSVVNCAEEVASQNSRFRSLTPRRLGSRWIGLLAVACGGLALAAVSSRVGPASFNQGVADPAGPETADRLRQIVLLSPGDQAAESLRLAADELAKAATPAEAKTIAAAENVRLADELRKAAPLLAAMGRLGESPAGVAVAAVLADPRQSETLLRAAAQAQVQSLQQAKMTDEQRHRLASDLRQAADRVAAANADLAASLRLAADALDAADWPRLLQAVTDVVRRVQPIARDNKLCEEAVRVLADRLADDGAPGRRPTVYASAASQAESAGMMTTMDPADQARLRDLPAERQRIVRRYFGGQ